MVREFRLPDVGEGLTEAEIVAWHVEPGDPVSEDQVVAEVETDKAVVEVPSPVDGTVKEIHAAPGEVVAVGDVIISFEVESEAGAGGAAAGERPPDRSDAAATGEPAAGDDGQSRGPDGRVFAAPSARRLARELGVDLSSVAGSGSAGRITGADVRAAAETATDDEGDGAGRTAQSTVAGTPESTGDTVERRDGTDAEAGDAGGTAARERTLATPATRRLARELDVAIDAVPAVEERDGEAFVTAEAVRSFAEAGTAGRDEAGAPDGRTERIPYRGIRRAVGEQMERAAYTAPHVTHHDAADVTDLVEIRNRLREAAEERGVQLTYLPFVIKAVVAALREHPYLNAELDENAEEIVLKHHYDIGVATATEAGLLVPVVAGADELSLLELAAEVQRLTERARDRSITREEMQGGTFTITNFGAIGGEYATPIVNYPEVGILGLGAIRERPRVVDGEVVPRDVLTLSLSIDHRVVDGAVAAAFVNTVKTYLEDPELLLLE